MGILRPHPPSHALPPATTPSSRLILSRSSLFLPPLPGLKMQTGTARLRHVSRCAADGACESSPDEGSKTSRFCEQVDKFVMGRIAALRAQGAKVKEIEATLFSDEVDQLLTLMPEIDSSPWLLANAHLRVDESSEMPPDTVKQIIRTYVWTFLKAAEDASHRKVDRMVIVSFIDALRGLAAISHILFEDTLAAVNNTEDSSRHYSPGYDVEAINHDLQCNIKESVKRLMTAPEREAYELLPSTLSTATLLVSEFVRLITDLRHKALAHAHVCSSDEDRGNK
ncbi:hypothetical protein EJB05_10619 [Eragrostis curvula]|uniref:Uncharacterized protein n=1 Tax=Eragrostis curvula TaxID=38414 RepID=A0A5J9VQF3_9POAL|nr:hypothetical protein EJB05_10619 [Eragrostis curvula]